MRLVLKKDGHPRGCNTEHISCVFINVLLKVQDLLIARLLGESTCQLVRIVLESLPVPIGVLLFLGEEEWANLGKVLRVQALIEVRKLLKSCCGLPMFPDSMVIDGHMDFLLTMQSKMLEAIKEGPASGRLTRANAFESRHPSLG